MKKILIMALGEASKMPLIPCFLGGLLIGLAIQPGIKNALMGMGGAILFYGAGYLRAKLTCKRQ